MIADSLVLGSADAWARASRRRGKFMTAAALPSLEQRKATRAEDVRRRRAPDELQTPEGNWQAGCGDFVGLTRYELDEPNAQAALEAAASFAQVLDGMRQDVASSEVGEERDIEELIRFVARFGPLSALPGITESRSGTRHDRLNLWSAVAQLEVLGIAYQAAVTHAPDTDRKDLTRFIIRHSHASLQSVRVRAVRDDLYGSVFLEAEPRTLEGALWLRIIRTATAGRSNQCLCGAYFDQREGRGRPFRFCERHRSRTERRRINREAVRGRSVQP